MEIVGYFVEKGIFKTDREINSWNAMVVIKEGNALQCYTGQEGHQDIKDDKYLNECVPITKEQYKEANKLFYTPPEYLGEDVTDCECGDFGCSVCGADVS